MKMNKQKVFMYSILISAIGGVYLANILNARSNSKNYNLLLENIEALTADPEEENVKNFEAMQQGPCHYQVYDVNYKIKGEGGSYESGATLLGFNGRYFSGGSLSHETVLPSGAVEISHSNTRDIVYGNYLSCVVILHDLEDLLNGDKCDWCKQKACAYPQDNTNWCNTRLLPPNKN